MRRRLLLVLSLFLLFATKGQAWVDYEYWFDNDRSTVQSGSSASTTLQLELDASALSSALHALHVQVMNSEGERGAVVTHYFFKVSGASSLAGRYWFDSNYSTMQTTSIINGAFDIDVSALKEGLHAFHYQTFEGEKAVSPVQTAVFFKSSETQGAMKIRYCVDGKMQNIIEGVRTGDTFQFDLDMSSLSDGLHTLAYSFADERDTRSRVNVQYFWKNNRFTAPVAKYFYWLNDKEAEADSVEVNQPSDPFTLVTMLPIEPQPIRSKQFAFAVEEGQPVVYARNDIHLRFMNMAGRYDETSATFTDINVREEIDAILLTPGGSHTANRPSENVIRWYKAIALQGDSLAFKLNAEASMQVFSPSGEELLNLQGTDVLDYKPVFASADGTYYVAVHDVTDSSVQQVTINYRRIHDGTEIVPLAGIAFVEPQQTVYPGESVNVAWTSIPENATEYEVQLNYDNSIFETLPMNESVLTVKEGTPVGEYTIVANAFDLDGNPFGISASLTVKVKNPDPEPYAVLSENNTVLTFYYDTQKEVRGGMDVGPFNEPTDRGWDTSCMNITTVVFDDSFADCTTLTNTAYWFLDCEKLTTIVKIQHLKTVNVTDMSCMFEYCSSLTSLDLSSFKTDKVKSMNYIFADCSSLTSLDVRGFKTGNVTDMSYMFDCCYSLTSLDLSGFKTDNVTNMERMFSECYSLTSLDLSGFKTDNVKYMSEMFFYCYSLTTIFAGDGWDTSKVTEGTNLFEGCVNLCGGLGTKFDEEHTDYTYAHIDGGTNNPGYFAAKKDLKNGLVAYYPFNGNANDESGNGNHVDEQTGNITLTTGVTGDADGAYHFEGGKMHVPNSESLQLTTTCTFSAYVKATEYTSSHGNCHCIIAKSYDKVGATMLEYYISNDSIYSFIGIHGNNSTNNFIDQERKALGEKGDFLNKWVHLANVIDGDRALYYINGKLIWEHAVTTPDFFNTINQQDMYFGMNQVNWFGLRGDLDEIRIYNYALSGDEIQELAKYAENPTIIDEAEPYAVLSKNNTTLTFYYDGNKESRGGMSVGPFNSAEERGWHNLRESISTVVFDTSFANCTTLNSTAYWFYECHGLSNITGISCLRTDNVTNMRFMFYLCSNLTTLDVSCFDTSNVTDMYDMFCNCYNLITLDVSHFNTSNVTNMGGMFTECERVTSLDVSHFNTSNVTNMMYMFCHCERVTSLDVSHFNTSNVTDMSGMFMSCVALTTLDLSHFDTSNVVDMNNMFRYCSNLTTIYAGYDWSTTKVTNSDYMFNDCRALVGGAGTAYRYGVWDATYARIDGGTSNPGYFTEKKMPPMTLAYDGHAMTMTSVAGASIYYTLDGSEPTTEDLMYPGEPVKLNDLCIVKAFAVADGREHSEVATFVVNSLFDGVTARVREGGSLDEAFQWCGGLAGADELAAFIWNCKDDFPEEAAANISNPNLLLYVNDYSQALRSGVRNVVANGIAQKITLTDNIREDGTRGPSGFYVPQAFRVQNDISYTHTYTQVTAKGDCRGWETIALPFDVQTVTHAVNGEAVPFAAYTSSGKRPFWLCRLTEDGFVDADKIEANTPYIISMPNSPQYSPFYCLNGEVTFSARNITVPVTELHPGSRGGASFIPAFGKVTASPSVYVLNVGEERWGYAEGSLFDRDYRDVHPFEAYRTAPSQGVPYMAIGDELRGATDIVSPQSSPERNGDLYDLSGRRLGDRPVEKGVYINNGRKVVVR